MEIVYKLDENNRYDGTTVKREGLKYTTVRPPDELLVKAFNDQSQTWYEGATVEEIEAFKNAPKPLSELDQLKKQQELMHAAIDDLIFSGGGF